MFKNKKGFSFFEMVVTCAIIGIMSTAVLVVANKRGRDMRETQLAAREVTAAIREAQAYALNGKVTATDRFACSTTFIPIFGNGNYEVRYTYHDNTNEICSGNGLYYQKILDNRVRFITTGDTSFSSPHGLLTTPTRIYRLNKNNANVCIIVCSNNGRIIENAIPCNATVCM